MSQDTFRGIEDAKKLIVDYLSKYGSGRWMDFERLGIPRATLSKALRRLIKEGKVVKEKRGMYVLRSSTYRDIIQNEYAPRLCELIGCSDTTSLTIDLVNDVGADIIYVDESHKLFVNNMMKYLRELESKNVDPSIRELIKVYSIYFNDKGFYIFVMSELAKFIRGLIIMKNCNDLTIGLTDDIFKKFKETIRAIEQLFMEYYGLNERSIDVLEKIKSVLRKYGYSGVIKFKILTSSITVNIVEYVEKAIMMTPQYFGMGGELLSFIYKLSNRFLEEGCRPLSSKEREELLKIIKITAS